MKTKFISLLTVIVLIFSLMAFTFVGASAAEAIAGDVNNDGQLDSDDAVYLLYNSLYGNEEYRIEIFCDYNCDGVITAADAVYLMNNHLHGDEEYPLGYVDGDVDMDNSDDGHEDWVPII